MTNLTDLKHSLQPAIDNAWNETNFDFTGNTISRTNGWEFTPKEDLSVGSLHVYANGVDTTTAHLWDAETGEMLASVPIETIENGWASARLNEPVLVETGKSYVVSANFPIAGGYMYLDDSSNVDERITQGTNWRVDSQNTMPIALTTNTWTPSVSFGIGDPREYIHTFTETKGLYWNAVVPEDTTLEVLRYDGSTGDWVEIENGTVFEGGTELNLKVASSDSSAYLDRLWVGDLLDSLTVTSLPDVLVHYTGHDLTDIAGMEVEATYPDGTTVLLEPELYMISGYDSTQAQESQELTVTVNNVTATYTIAMLDPEPDFLRITHPPYKYRYFHEEPLNVDGLRMELVYTDGATEEITVTLGMVSSLDTSSVGRKELTITYEDFEVALFVLVLDRPSETTGDGSVVGIRFSEELISDPSGSVNAFRLHGHVHEWVDGPDHNGPFMPMTSDVLNVYHEPINKDDLKHWSGVKKDAVVTDERLTLDVKEEVDS